MQGRLDVAPRDQHYGLLLQFPETHNVGTEVHLLDVPISFGAIY